VANVARYNRIDILVVNNTAVLGHTSGAHAYAFWLSLRRPSFSEVAQEPGPLFPDVSPECLRLTCRSGKSIGIARVVAVPVPASSIHEADIATVVSWGFRHHLNKQNRIDRRLSKGATFLRHLGTEAAFQGGRI
jgi:hypothetical protein